MTEPIGRLSTAPAAAYFPSSLAETPYVEDSEVPGELLTQLGGTWCYLPPAPPAPIAYTEDGQVEPPTSIWPTCPAPASPAGGQYCGGSTLLFVAQISSLDPSTPDAFRARLPPNGILQLFECNEECTQWDMMDAGTYEPLGRTNGKRHPNLVRILTPPFSGYPGKYGPVAPLSEIMIEAIACADDDSDDPEDTVERRLDGVPPLVADLVHARRHQLWLDGASRERAREELKDVGQCLETLFVGEWLESLHLEEWNWEGPFGKAEMLAELAREIVDDPDYHFPDCDPVKGPTCAFKLLGNPVFSEPKRLRFCCVC